MKTIHFFKTKAEYDSFVAERVFTNTLITGVPLYQKLIRFVCNEKAPIFFEPSQYSENRNFANYANWQVMRNYYDNKLIQNMFYLHEFMHMAQDLPRNPDMTREDFVHQFIKTEYVASNETEILIHYRQPEIRKQVFADRKILFDVIVQKLPVQPTARQLLEMRRKLIETNSLVGMFAPTDAEQTIMNELRHFAGNKIWARVFFEKIQGKQLVDYPYANVEAENYEYRLNNYADNGSQEKYERLTLTNIQNMYVLLNLPNQPERFEDCELAIENLQGRVFYTHNDQGIQNEKVTIAA